MKTVRSSTKKTSSAKKAPTQRREQLNETNGQKRPTHYELFKDYIGIIKDGPPDLAKNHKLYACGAKKWKWK